MNQLLSPVWTGPARPTRCAWSTTHGTIRARFEIANTGKSFIGLVRRLGKLAVVGVAIERPDGPLVQAMLDADLTVVVITPRQVKALAQPLWGQWSQVRRWRRLRCWPTCCAPTATGSLP